MNAANYLNNSMSSSVSYSKTFQGEPQVNMSLSATHSQNTNTQTINMTLPTFQEVFQEFIHSHQKLEQKKVLFKILIFNITYVVRIEF